MQKVKISFVIVNYNSDKELRQCLKSINTKISHEIIVVDNNKENIGYGAGINKGAIKSKGEYLFILNPDTKFYPKTIEKLVKFLDKNPGVGIVGPNLVHENGNLYEYVGTGKLTPITAFFSLSFVNKLFPNNPVSRYYWCKEHRQDLEKEVEVVPGTAFLIRNTIFKKIGGFDEKFFLYFEETDLSKRVRDLGYKIIILKNALLLHIWGVSTSNSRGIDNIFAKSRFYYFKKNYGLLWAYLVEFVVNLGKYDFIFLIVLVIAIFLRFYRINENLVFHGELGDNYLAIKNTLRKGVLPLLGPPTSHPWLSFGPLFYYILTPFLILNHWNPNTGAYFFAAVASVFVLINYFVVRKLFDEKIALISSYLIAISTIWINLARQARFFSMVTYLFYPFLLLSVKTIREPSIRNFFLLGLTFGVMLNFHLAPIFLVPPIAILFWQKRKKIKYKFEKAVFCFLGFMIPNIPFLIYNFKTHFNMLTKFLVWIPYRSAIYHKFNFGFTVDVIYKFFGGIFILIPILYVVYKMRKNKVVQILSLFLSFGIVALILHKDPPEHYFYVLYAIPAIFFSIFLSRLKPFLRNAVLILITVLNLSFLFSNKWFYIDQNKIVKDANVPYKLQLKVVKQILNDANHEPFNLQRVGYSDKFDDYYEQNYDYLLWLNGNEPKKNFDTGLTYIIIEYPNMQIFKETK